jgi:hypothetical protein
MGAIAMSAMRQHSDRTHARMLALMDELIEIGRPPDPEDGSALTAERRERTPVAV